MKLVILTAILAAVSSSPVAETNQWPWQVGQEYEYNVLSYTGTEFESETGNGNVLITNLIVRVLEPGRLVAKLANPVYGQAQNQQYKKKVFHGLDLNPVKDIDHPFEILVEGGRVVSLKIPTSFTDTYENLLKGLVSALQVDLSPTNHVHNFPNNFDKETFQGLFKKMETDVTGDCETLYSVSPISAGGLDDVLVDKVENPVEIIKSKNYGSCENRVGFYFGVPEGAVWNGIAYKEDEKQFIKHNTETRLVVGEKGTIYKSEAMSSVFVNPLVYGKQKAEIYSYVGLSLSSLQPKTGEEWPKTVEYRDVNSLLFTYNLTRLISRGDSNIADAQKLLQEMTPLLQDINNLPKADFLSKFNMLIESLMYMSSEQLTQMTASIEIAKSSENTAKSNMWVVYRDAVAQTGTIAAFKEIKSWILTKKIEGIEAAEVISSMASVLRFPTKELMNEFFEFAMSPEVQEQTFVNTTTLLAVTKFIASGDEDLFVNEKVIPRLSQELKQAVENGDKNKAQVYVRVLGNLAHPNILKVFAPYLEGKIAVTKYLRIQMVISLKTLANKKNEYVRAVLFSLLKNTAEPYEVRVAAALNIFLADPPQEMMQIMGHMTFADPSTQVRAVLANSITFAAGLKDPRFATLAKTAKSVLNMLPEEKFGYRYSTDSLIDDYTSDDELSHFREVSFIGSKNNLLPVYERGALRFGSTGWTEEDWFTLSVSDMQHLMEYIYGLFIHQGEKPKDEFEIKIKTILEKLNIKPEHQCDLEGSFFLNNWNQQMLLTFTEAEINSLILSLIKESNHLKQSIKSNYIKIVLQKDIFITFPLAMGMPFVFEYSEPTLLHVQNEAIATPGMSGNIIDKLQFTYARNLDGSAGYLDTFNDVYVAAGVVNKLQLHIPFRTRWDYELNEFRLILEWPDRNANLIHMSVWPYTTLQKTDSFQTAAENPLSKLIERPKKVISTDIKFGQSIGTIFQFQANSYSSDYKDPTSLFDNDLLTNVRNLLYQKDIALTQFNLKYLARESKNKAFTFTVFTNTIYNQLQTKDEFEPAAVIKDITPEARRKEIITRVASEIEHGKVQLVDISLEFHGRETVEFILTGALANSYEDNKVHAALLYNGFQQQINAVFNMTKPEFTPLNFELALKNNLTVEYDVDILIGNDDNIHLKGVGKRSDMYKELLLNDPLGKQCLKDIGENNLYQKACYKMLLKAHAPDYFKGTLTYKDLKQTDEAFIFNIFELLENWNDWEKEEDVLKTVDDGKLEIEAQAFYYDNYINYKLTSKFGEVRLNNVEGLSYYPYAMSFYAPLSNWERARNWFTGYQNLPFCTVDDNKVWTFSGRSYEYNMTGSWHVVMVDEAKDFGNELLILAQRPEKGQAEVYITYKTRTGKTLEIILTPKTYQVISNAKEICEDGVSIYYDDVAKIPLVEYYSIRGGFDEIQVFSINNGAIRLIFDDHRLVIFTDDHRSTTRGLCGQSSTEIRDDYITPFGLVDSPQLYGASFALDGDHADPKTEELKKEAKLKAYQPVTKYTSILRSDAEWSKVANESF
ncbi:vitellogenin-like [Helicoverpa zea]|uniref:vitellogenin-like n=1 Tax=Helicoverpa zea TaxID=7113 RepID=UPI001F57B98A|nr:vitellogenin-like [Helicoverpa zea]